jgi:hypothetical protein
VDLGDLGPGGLERGLQDGDSRMGDPVVGAEQADPNGTPGGGGASWLDSSMAEL